MDSHPVIGRTAKGTQDGICICICTQKGLLKHINCSGRRNETSVADVAFVAFNI